MVCLCKTILKNKDQKHRHYCDNLDEVATKEHSQFEKLLREFLILRDVAEDQAQEVARSINELERIINNIEI